MRVFELQTDPDRFCNFAVADERGTWIHGAFDGRPLPQRWEALRITAADEDDSSAELGDYAVLGVIPVFSGRAAEALGDILRPNGDLLPLVFSRGVYFAYNVRTVLEALDEERSQVVRFQSSRRIMHVDEFVFFAERLRDAVIFKIPQFPKSHVLVTQDFVDRTQRERLQGMRFRELWGDSNRAKPATVSK